MKLTIPIGLALIFVFGFIGCQTIQYPGPTADFFGPLFSERKLQLAVYYPPGARVIDSEFMENRISYKHQGIDIGGSIGEPIIAAADGKVLEATIESCWGPTVMIDHGMDKDGRKILALYGHVGEMLVKRGDQVRRGEVIARLGDNEKRFRCIGGVRHLHFQIGRRRQFDRNGAWGHSYFLADGLQSVNPHLLWADGPGIITCFTNNRTFKPGTLTYPFLCNVVKVSGYTSKNLSATSNVFELKEVTSEFSGGDIVTFGDFKKEHKIWKVEALKKLESGNFQKIVLSEGVGFVITPGIKVSVVR